MVGQARAGGQARVGGQARLGVQARLEVAVVFFFCGLWNRRTGSSSVLKKTEIIHCVSFIKMFVVSGLSNVIIFQEN